jgi:hypothetical protein
MPHFGDIDLVRIDGLICQLSLLAGRAFVDRNSEQETQRWPIKM